MYITSHDRKLFTNRDINVLKKLIDFYNQVERIPIHENMLHIYRVRFYWLPQKQFSLNCFYKYDFIDNAIYVPYREDMSVVDWLLSIFDELVHIIIHINQSMVRPIWYIYHTITFQHNDVLDELADAADEVAYTLCDNLTKY